MSTHEPLTGPLDVDPTSELSRTGYARFAGAVNPAGELARAMLDTALEGLHLGRYDARIVEWLKGWDQPTTATVASLLRRSFDAGVAVGRFEQVEESTAVQQARGEAESLAAEADVLRRALELAYLSASRADAALDDETADRQGIAERLIVAVRAAAVRAAGGDGEAATDTAGWEQFPADCPSSALRGVWHRDPEDVGDPIPALYVDQGRAQVEVGQDVGPFTIAEVREFAWRLVQAATLAGGAR